MLRKSLESGSTPPPKGFGSSKNKIEVNGKNVRHKKLVSKIDQKFWRCEIRTYFAKLPADLIDVGSRCNKRKTYKKLNPKTSPKNFGSFSILFTLFFPLDFRVKKSNSKQKH